MYINDRVKEKIIETSSYISCPHNQQLNIFDNRNKKILYLMYDNKHFDVMPDSNFCKVTKLDYTTCRIALREIFSRYNF